MNPKITLYKNTSVNYDSNYVSSVSSSRKITLTLINNSQVKSQKESLFSSNKFAFTGVVLGMLLGFAFNISISYSVVDAFFAALGVSLIGAMFGILVDETSNR